MRARYVLFLLALPGLLLSACKKEKDEQGPTIEIIFPGNSHTLQVPDTLDVVVNVSDEHIVSTVWISLADENGVPIAPTIVANVNSASITVERQLVVNNEQIASGNYSLAVRATDGTNTRSAFRSIHVLEAPLRSRAIFVVPATSGSITRIDSAGGQTSFAQVQEVSEAAMNSYGQHLYVATAPFAPLQVFAASDQGSSWELPNQNAQTSHYFTSVTTDRNDRRTYVSSNDGLIRGYLGSNLQFNAQALPGYTPYHNVVIGDRLINEQRSIGTNEKRLVSYAYSSGMLLQFFALDLDVVGMFQLSDQQALVFGNRNGEGVIQLWNTVQGGHFEMRVFNEGQIAAVDQINTTTYVAALPGQVVRFNYSSNSVTTLYGEAARDVAYDKATGAIYAGVEQQLVVIDPATGAVTATVDVPAEVGRILPLLNR